MLEFSGLFNYSGGKLSRENAALYSADQYQVEFKRYVAEDGSKLDLHVWTYENWTYDTTADDFIKTNISAESFSQKLGLHPASMQYARRIMTESKFWRKSNTNLSIILSFPRNPHPSWDFLSLTYDIPGNVTTAFVRKVSDSMNDEYETRLAACEIHWAHPLILPIVMIDAALIRLEASITHNHDEVTALENDVAICAGFIKPDYELPLPTITELMDRAHTALKGGIKLLDTVRWTARAVKLLLDAGNELDNAVRVYSTTSQIPARVASRSVGKDWIEVKQYLEDLLRLCDSVEAEPTMSLERCKAQSDILFSQMAQEDNNLNTRVAVSSSRDSSAMKVLAFITALFLPGSYIAALFSMSMFNWQAGASTSSSGTDKGPTVMPIIWIYCVIAVILTLTIIVNWRLWWVMEDRAFRSHLKKEVADEHFWNSMPRRLETTFWQDFFKLYKKGTHGKKLTGI